MKKNGNIAMLPGGIYPGESLWSIVNRFVWLNRPTFKEANEFFEGAIDRRSLFYSKKAPILGDEDVGVSGDAFKCISLSQRKVSNAVLPSFLRNVSSIRFCPDCASQGFHATVFQLPILDRCPAHDAPLESKCPSCGHTIDSYFSNDTVKHPYACKRCGHDLVVSRLKFFQAERPLGIDRIVKAVRWLKGLENLSMGWGDFPSFEWSSRSYHGVDDARLTLALALAAGFRNGLDADWKSNELRNVSSLHFRSLGIRGGEMGVRCETPCVLDREAIYKSFLRHRAGQLRAALSRYGGIAKIRMTPIAEACRALPDLMNLVLSMLIFRAHCECWRTDKEFSHPIEVACFRRVHGKIHLFKNFLRPHPGAHLPGMCVPHFESGRLPVDVRAWVEGQLFTRQLSWMWREASEYASEMVTRGRILRRPRLRGIYMPQFFTLTRVQESLVYRLDFWSGRRVLVRPDFASAWYAAEEEREERYWAAVFAALDRP